MDSIHNSGEDPWSAKRAQGPRLYHKKSRTGCLRCKARRVKCDEKRPSCSGCSRHVVECVYPSPASLRETRSRKSPQQTAGSSPYDDPVSLGHSPDPGLMSAGFVQSATSSGGAVTFGPLGHSASMSSASTPPQAPWLSLPPSEYGDSFDPRLDPELQLEFGPADSTHEPPESRQRRLWELRLLHNYVETVHATTLPGAPSAPGAFWSKEVPLLALESDSILYPMLANSALNMWAKSRDPSERQHLLYLQQLYLGMALREQRAAAAVVSPETAATVCMSSLAILAHALALVQTTVTEDNDADDVETTASSSHPHRSISHPFWEPPLEWLRIGRATGIVFSTARNLLFSSAQPSVSASRSDAILARFLAAAPASQADEIFTPQNRAPYLWLLDNDADLTDGELDDKAARNIYHGMLSYIGWARAGIVQHQQQHGHPTSRHGSGSSSLGLDPGGGADAARLELLLQQRLGGFAVWMPELLQEFLAQRRPRALVCLAWFFALWAPFGDLWMVADVGRRQVRAIRRVIPPLWQAKLDPLLVPQGRGYDVPPPQLLGSNVGGGSSSGGGDTFGMDLSQIRL